MIFTPARQRRRQRRLAGRHALVDGIPFTMPVNSLHSPALMAAFSIDGEAAAGMLPGGEIHPLRLPSGRAVLAITVVNYRDTDIGQYIEFSIAIVCTHGPRPAPRILPMALPPLFGTGQYVLDLPVSSEISVKGGKGIWGMPKHQANLDFVITQDTVSSQYDLDGLLGVRIEIDRPSGPRLPLRTRAVNYCSFRGMLIKSSIAFASPVQVALGRRASARLFIGDSPRVALLRTLDIAVRPLLVAYLQDSHGLLDDHAESWFVTSTLPISERPEGLESVVGLGLSQEWLDPPKAKHSDPSRTVGAATVPTVR